jgi:O-antigen/teichoic acid export membrane protein
MNALFVSIYLQIDVILLANLQGDHETGLYRGAVMLLSLFPIVAETLSNGIYPRMSRHLGNSTLAGEELSFATRVLLAVSVPAAVGGLMTATPLLIFLGGKDFAASALLFQVMVPLLPMRFLNNAFGMTMSALNHQEDRTRGAIYAALVNVAVNLYAIPQYGALGAAFTTFLTETFLILFMRWRISSLVTNLRIGESLLRVGIPAAGMACFLWLLPPVHVIFQILCGILVYAGTGRWTGAWHPRDLRRLKGV